ncbi:MAG: hypothetical protein JWR27_527 [Aeromicrobium sp.]|nr:hypothetical protein [Aeromicrobium sp.]
MTFSSRAVWFVAGSAAGVYATAKARRAAHRLSMPGLVDQAAALGLGWRAFSDELHDGMQTREHDIARRLIDPTDHSTLSLDEAQPDKDHH